MKSVVCLAAVFAALSSGAWAQTRPAAPTEARDTFLACFNATQAQLEPRHPTPERYQMAMEGACLDEEQASITEFEQYLRRRDGGFSDVTDKTMQEIRAWHHRLRAQKVSDYTVRYETAKP